MLQTITLFGHTINLYDFFNNAAVVGQIIIWWFFLRHDYAEAVTLPKLAYMYLNKKKKENVFWRWFFVIVFLLIMQYIGVTITNIASKPISLLFLGTTDHNFFPNILVNPVSVFLLYLLFRNSPLKILDLSAPNVAVALIFYKIACFCWGCCYGVEWEHGMWNQNNGRAEFPVQLVEIACAVIMLVILLLLLHKKGRKTGILYPLFMMMYCGSRFVSEFWRDDYPFTWFGGRMTGYHIQCIVGFVLGAVFMFLTVKWGDRFTAYIDAKNQALLDKHEKKIRAANRKKNPPPKKHKKR